MKIKPLTQLRETISRALSGVANLHKPFQTFFICTMELYLSVKERLNFTSMARNSDSCESRFRQNFRKSFDWLPSISTTIVADAFFSKINFVLGLDCLGFNLVSRLRDDAVLRYLYTGERTGKRGCPKKFDGKVDICNPDGKVFTTTSFTDGKDSIRLTSGIVWCNSLKRKVVLAIVEYLDSDKKTQVRKLYLIKS